MTIITIDTHTFDNGDIVVLQIQDGRYRLTTPATHCLSAFWERARSQNEKNDTVRVVHYSVFFGEKVTDTDETDCATGNFIVHQTEHFHVLDYSTALKAFKQRMESNQANKATNLGKSLEQIHALGMSGNVKEIAEGK